MNIVFIIDAASNTTNLYQMSLNIINKIGYSQPLGSMRVQIFPETSSPSFVSEEIYKIVPSQIITSDKKSVSELLLVILKTTSPIVVNNDTSPPKTVIIFMTDGKSMDFTNARNTALELQQQGEIELYAISIGLHMKRKHLTIIASAPKHKHLLQIASHSDIKKVEIGLVMRLCS